MKAFWTESMGGAGPAPGVDGGPARRWRNGGRLSLLAVAVVAGACTSVQTTQPGAVGVERSQLMSVSRAEVDKASAQAYDKMLAEAQKQGKLNRDAALTARVRSISSRLIAQSGVFRADAPGWKWEVNVFQTDQVNAFCMAGGKIGVYSGLVAKLKLTDDELAAVIGHEIAHALREHVREQVSQRQATQLGMSVLGALTGSQAVTQLGNQVAQVTFGLPKSRQAETEADRIGVELAARAGYDPRAAVSLWQKMGSQGGSRPPEFLSTHPDSATRQQDLTQMAAVVMPLYEQARARR
ncbi:MAG: Beta-barrel assembly-enhancing protease [Paracidovorax wautersii]|uniref:Beta-barrel assembly-enhancing protease n=1 Tax=Paracidovorax wautersii TaxID=1177982 RepID=A0A7V8FKW2_9BURK|nr:MAG: Beta-barrel assembly-enhancing protease [Paracidovorax wautersii]